MTDRLQELEMQFEKESNRLENCDGMEPFQVLMSIALMMDQDADEVLENEHFISLMRASQSNPTETLEILRNLVELDNQISECDDLNDPPVCEHGSPLSESKRYDGFTGAPIYVTTFKDGCQEVDDSLDNINWVK